MKNNINIQPMPGFMELLPEQQMVFNDMLKSIRAVYDLYGFRPIETPILERSEVLLAKGGGETDKQIYRFTKGDSDISMRFDLTVPLARYIANNQNDLIFPFKIGNVGKVYRGERPQAGRFREFYQCDFDVVSRDTLDISYDAEIVSMISTMFKNLGLENFKVRINNRKVLNGFFKSLEIENFEDVLRSIDKLEKQGKEVVVGELKEFGLDQDKIDRIFEFVSIKDDVVGKLKELGIDNEMFKIGLEELEYVDNQVKVLGVKDDNFEIDLTIARGLDYYTGTVYETILTDYPEFGSVCSGGRYDDLASYYTSSMFPGVGCSIGLTRLFDCLLRNNLLDFSNATPTKVLVVGMDGFEDIASNLGSTLREVGINTEVMNGIKNSFKYANRLGIRFVVVIGEEEVKNSTYALKDMVSGEQVLLSKEDLLERVK